MRRLTDEQLVQLCLDGKQEAFAVLVERYQNQIFSLAYRLGGDYDESRDMAQEAFIKVYQELGSFDTSRKFFPWFYRVAHNCCINSLNKRKNQVVSFDDLYEQADIPQSHESNPEMALEKNEELALLRKCLAELPEQFRIPLLMKYIEGLSYKEISERLEIPVSTIETRLFRGRNLLQEKLSPSLGKVKNKKNPKGKNKISKADA